MRKNQLFFALLGSMLSLGSAFAQVTGTNIAQGAAVLCTNEGGDTKDGAAMTDGNTGSTVEFGRTGDNNGVGVPVKVNEGEQTEAHVANAKVTLDNYYDLSEIQIYFAGYAPVKYCVKVSKDDTEYTTVYTSSEESADNAWETVGANVEDLKGVKYIKFCPLVSKNYKITIVGEIQAAGTVVEHTSTSVSAIALSASGDLAYTGTTAITLSSVVKDQDGYVYEGTPELAWNVQKGGEAAAAADYTVSEGVFTFNTAGTYTITQRSGAVVSNAVAVVAGDNVAQGKTIAASAGFAHPERAIDGDWGNAAGGDNDPASGSLTIDLGGIYTLNAVSVKWNTMAYAKNYTIGVGAAVDGEFATVGSEENWTASEYKDYVFENTEARYVKLTYSGLANEGWGAQLRELAVMGTEVVHNDAVLKTITLSAAASAAYVGDEVVLTPVYNDQYGAAANVNNVTWTVEPAEGASVTDGTFTATQAGRYTVTVTATDANDNETTVTSAGVVMTVTVDPNIAKGASVTMTNEDGTSAAGANITDGNTGTFNEAGGIPNTTADGYDNEQAATANVKVDLGGHYDLTSIEVWLGEFYPTLFSVAVSADDATYTTVLNGQAVSQNNARFTIEANDGNLDGVQYIKLLPLTCNNAFKAARIYEIKAFGKLSAADELAHTTAGGIDTYTGVWVEANFDTASASGEIDLTAVASLPDAIPATANANALFYVPSTASATLKAQANVVAVNGETFTMQQLVVNDAKPLSFTKAGSIAVQSGKVVRPIAQGEIAAIYLPFGIRNEGAVMTYFPTGALQTVDDVTKLNFGTNGENGVLGAYVPSVLVAQEDIAELTSAGAFTLQVKEGDFESQLTASRDFQVLTGSDVANGYGLKEGEFHQMNNTNKVNPFHSFIKPQSLGAKAILIDLDGTVVAITGVTDEGKVQTSVIYNLAGQPVSHPQGGIYIVNGKKVYIR